MRHCSIHNLDYFAQCDACAAWDKDLDRELRTQTIGCACDPDVNYWCDIHAKDRTEYMALAELERIANATRHGSELAAYKTALDDVRAMKARLGRPW